MNGILGLILIGFAAYGVFQLMKKPFIKKKVQNYINSDEE